TLPEKGVRLKAEDHMRNAAAYVNQGQRDANIKPKQWDGMETTQVHAALDLQRSKEDF
ncbi:37325_t:CDS:2, partial [Gigaspora margarita]